MKKKIVSAIIAVALIFTMPISAIAAKSLMNGLDLLNLSRPMQRSMNR